MIEQRLAKSARAYTAAERLPPVRESELDWSRAIRSVDRKRRANGRSAPYALPDWAYRQTTLVSFGLDGIEVGAGELDDSLAAGPQGRAFRSRQRQRLRNHVAILRVIDRDVRHHTPQSPDSLLRWYTSISSGLSTSNLAVMQSARGEELLRRINSPQLRLNAAIQEIAQLHCELLAEPIFPSFNGILARLLLRAHLGRCGLPPILFDLHIDSARSLTASFFTSRLIQLVEQSLDRLRQH